MSSPVAALLTYTCGPSDISAALSRVLNAAGWTVTLVTPERLRAAEREGWDIVVIPAGRVTEDILVLAGWATRHPATRVALVSHDRDPLHIADILRSGVDDYLVAPFQPEECLARLTALAVHARAIRNHQVGTRRGAGPGSPGLSIDPATRSIRDGAVRVALSTREWDVLAALLAAGERMATASELAAAIWGTPSDGARVVSTISRLRRKLSAADVQTLDVVTVRGLGYAAKMAG